MCNDLSTTFLYINNPGCFKKQNPIKSRGQSPVAALSYPTTDLEETG